MKKKIIIFIVFILFPFSVSANSISLSCDNDVVKGNSISCALKGNSDKIVIAVSAKIRTGSNITFSSFVPASVWQGDGNEGKIDLYTDKDISGNFNIGTITFNVNSLVEGGSDNITVESVSFYDENGTENSVKSNTKTIRIASSNNNLASLEISSGVLNPSFNSNITTYSTTIDSSSIKITATPSNSYAKVSGDIGTKTLNYGNNNLKITVTSENGNTKTYTINVIRPDNRSTNTPTNKSTTKNSSNSNTAKSSNNYLKEISLNYGSITLEKDKFEYDLTIPYEIDSIDIKAITEDASAKVEISDNNNLKVGLNQIKILVTAEDNTTKTYTINVIRKEEGYTLSNNNYISKLTIKGYNLNFNKDILKYNLKIKKDKKLDITIELEDNKSNYKIIGNDNLKNNSIIKIIVTAEDNTTRTYEIYIKNKDKTIKIIFISIITILILINIIRLVIKYRSKLWKK